MYKFRSKVPYYSLTLLFCFLSGLNEAYPFYILSHSRGLVSWQLVTLLSHLTCCRFYSTSLWSLSVVFPTFPPFNTPPPPSPLLLRAFTRSPILIIGVQVTRSIKIVRCSNTRENGDILWILPNWPKKPKLTEAR